PAAGARGGWPGGPGVGRRLAQRTERVQGRPGVNGGVRGKCPGERGRVSAPRASKSLSACKALGALTRPRGRPRRASPQTAGQEVTWRPASLSPKRQREKNCLAGASGSEVTHLIRPNVSTTPDTASDGELELGRQPTPPPAGA